MRDDKQTATDSITSETFAAATAEIDKLFSGKTALIPLVIAGDGSLLRTRHIMEAMAENGADGIGVVFPFSDPLMESEAMCAGQARALRTPPTPDAIFDMIAQFRASFDTPVYIEVYTNCLFVYGYDSFAARCATAGVSAIYVKDSNFQTAQELIAPFHKYGVFFLSAINWLSARRDFQIAQQAEGFLCCFDHKNEIQWSKFHDCMMILRAANDKVPCVMDLPNPQCAQLQIARNNVDGIQISSAIARLVEQYGTDAPVQIGQFIKECRAAIDAPVG